MLYPLSDYGNAERLAARFAGVLRYTPGREWMAWSGQRWNRDLDGAAMRMVKETVRSIPDEFARADNPQDRAAACGFALKSESKARLQAALDLAQSERSLVVPSDAWDADRFLLAVANGTIDLRTGALRNHKPDDLITKLSPVHYEWGARSALWERFLDRVTGGDKELAGFLQRAVGYSLTGETREEKLFFLHGPAASGKSTFIETITALLGDYAATADFETFLKRPGGRGASNDIARLAGQRIAVGTEIDHGRELAEGLVKQLTGGDTITARYLYRESFEFKPQFKLWFVGNERPYVRAEDGGLWRRILHVPFRHPIPECEQNPLLKEQFRSDSERTGILAWAVEGCLLWQKDRLGIPASVRAYTEEYRSENDPVGAFLAECCQLDRQLVTSRRLVASAYDTWAIENGERTFTPRQLATALKERGVEPGPNRQQERVWYGIGLIPASLGETPASTDSWGK